MNKPKIALGMPHQNDFRDSVEDMLHQEIASAKNWGIGKCHRIAGGSCISSLRWQIAKKFLEGKDDFLLFFDSDMQILKTGSIDLLLETSKKYNHQAIISALFGKKSPPFAPTYLPLWEEDKELIKAGNILEKESTGMAFTLLPRQVIQAVFGHCANFNELMQDVESEFQRYEQPFQPFIYNDKYTGEDRAFCLRAKFIDIKTIIDTRVIIAHIGDCAFTPTSWVEGDK